MIPWYKEYDNLDIRSFLDKLTEHGWQWIVKRLSGNDTNLTGAHQVGVYYPKTFFEKVFPSICNKDVLNPDILIKEAFTVSHGFCCTDLRVIYYNNKFTGSGTRNEFRITRWGGDSPVQNKENTGSVLIFAAKKVQDSYFSVSWVARTIEEEIIIEDWVGNEIFPGEFYLYDGPVFEKSVYINNIIQNIPKNWFIKFPSGIELFKFVAENVTPKNVRNDIDKLLVKRRDVEFKLFSHIEQRYVFPEIKKGFSNVDDFIKYANSVTNRRKSRAGASLEYNLEDIFKLECVGFEMGVVTEENKRPDFIFPSGAAYHSKSYPENGLHMLGAKTCCKDRWRQVINEANRIKQKHLFTLQEGISDNQLKEMYSENVVLVIPKENIVKFPKSWQSKILNLRSFVELRKQNQQKYSFNV